MANVTNPSVTLTPDLDAVIQRRIASGRYGSRNEVIRAALRVLERDEEAADRKLADLDTAIARGIADAEAGRVMDLDEAFRQIRKGIDLTEPDSDR